MSYILKTSAIATVMLSSALGAQIDTRGAIPMTYTDEAAARGVLEPGYGRGTAMVDLDNDGMLDLIVTMSEMEDAFLRQKADGTFEKMNAAWGIPATLDRGWGVLAADFDNDGDRDVYFPTGGFSGAQANTILRNDLSAIGKFTDMTANSGDTQLATFSSFGGTVLDYDNDGDLDIFVSNNGVAVGRPVRNALLRNDGNFTFTDVSRSAGITQLGDFRHCSSGDVDNDGFVDIFVGDFVNSNVLYHNNGDGTFTDTAASAGVEDPGKNFGGVLIDFNNDGWLDLYGARYQFSGNYPSGLYINNADGTFTDVRNDSGMTRQKDMGHNCADLNADGFPDIYIGTGHPNLKELDPVKLVRPAPGGRLRVKEVGFSAGFQALGKTRCHGIAFGDINRDGNTDVYVNNGGPAFVPVSWQENTLFISDGNANKWIQVEPIGVISNKSAVGVRMMARTGDNVKVFRLNTVGRGFCNTDSPIAHFGLGPSSAVLDFVMKWPSGIQQDYLDLESAKAHKIYETGFTWSGTPAVGANINVKAFGVPNGTVTLFYSDVAGETRDRAQGGTVRMGGSITFETPFTLGSDGKANTTFQIPNDPNLSGETLYLQAKVQDSSGVHPLTLTHNIKLVIP
ncbi:MAG: CRTAC1 family protein [Planctomycetota bacterium]|nr:CRTAC1 family protein [Planctomycetota bacterium]MDA1113457.1 CRTAC1 family protein [Planctomycetota bacterium]